MKEEFKLSFYIVFILPLFKKEFSCQDSLSFNNVLEYFLKRVLNNAAKNDSSLLIHFVFPFEKKSYFLMFPIEKVIAIMTIKGNTDIILYKPLLFIPLSSKLLTMWGIKCY